MKELDMYSTVENSVKMVVANKLDMVRSPVCLSGLPLQLSASPLHIMLGQSRITFVKGATKFPCLGC